MPTTFTLQEAAAELNIPYRRLRTEVFSDRWPHRKLSQRRRVMTDEDIAAVLELTRSKTVEPTTPINEKEQKAAIKRLLTC